MASKGISEPSFGTDLKKHWANFDKKYREEMFKRDAMKFKLGNILKKDELVPFLNHFRDKYYERFLECFMDLQSGSLMWPGVTWHQIFLLFRKLDLYNNVFSMGNIDQAFKDASLPEDIKESRAEVTFSQALLRYQFFEFIMRVAIERYYLSLESDSPNDALDQLVIQFFKNYRSEFEVNSREVREFKIIGEPSILKSINSKYRDMCLAYTLVQGDSDFVSVDGLKRWLGTTDLVVGDDLLWKICTYSRLPPLAEISSTEGGSIGS